MRHYHKGPLRGWALIQPRYLLFGTILTLQPQLKILLLTHHAEEGARPGRALAGFWLILHLAILCSFLAMSATLPECPRGFCRDLPTLFSHPRQRVLLDAKPCLLRRSPAAQFTSCTVGQGAANRPSGLLGVDPPLPTCSLELRGLDPTSWAFPQGLAPKPHVS